jgi:CRISPR-associated protein Cas5d
VDRAAPVPINQHLGFMLYDVFDLASDETPDCATPFVSLFDASICDGVISVPPFQSIAVRKPGKV